MISRLGSILRSAATGRRRAALGMCVSAAGLLLAPAIAYGTGNGLPSDASYIDTSVRVEGSLLEYQFLDVERDGSKELVLAVRTPRGERELQLHRMTAKAIEPKPYRTIPILKDILAWTFADVREELPGAELVLLTRQGAWSFDPAKTSYKGNIKKLCELDLLYDVPSPRAFPYWEYVIQGPKGASGADRLLLPLRGEFQVFGPVPPSDDSELPWGPTQTFRGTGSRAPVDPEDQARRAREAKREGDKRKARFEVTIGDVVRPFLGNAASTSLLASESRIQAPALVDMDGDGRQDLLLLTGDRLHVHLAGPNGIPEQPTRVEVLPDYLSPNDQRAALRLVDVDGDGRLDVLGLWNEDVDGFENAQWRVYVMRSTKDALLPPAPTQVLRFEAAELRVTVTDIDGDGTPDLALRRFVLPTMLESVTGLEFRYTHLIYLGKRRGRFENRPALKQEAKYDEESVRDILANRVLSLDCSGDGIADLVEVDLSGQLGVRRVRKDSSFFGGTTWQIDEGYWKRYGSRGSVSSLDVVDLNGDRLGDIISASDDILTVYLSTRR